mgnify:CR=1 FL=1
MPGTASNLGVSERLSDPNARMWMAVRAICGNCLSATTSISSKALAAGNAGPHRVEQYGGVPPCIWETRKYVASIVRDFNRKKIAQQRAANSLTAKSPPTSGQEQVANGRQAGRYSEDDACFRNPLPSDLAAATGN